VTQEGVVRDLARSVLVLGAGVLAASCGEDLHSTSAGGAAAGLALPPAAATAAAVIDADALASVVTQLADYALQGRGPSSLGDRAARRFIRRSLQEIGLEAGGPGGSWEQPIALVGIETRMPGVWSFRGAGRDLALEWWNDYIAASGVQEDEVAIDGAEVVFVGYGIAAPEEGWDDFKGADLHGKILLMLNNDPDWDPRLFAGERRLYYGRWDYKYESAARQGAAGAILIHTTPSAGYPFQVVQTSWTGEQFELRPAGEPRTPLHAWVTEDAARRLVAVGGHDLDELTAAARSREFRPRPLGVTTSIRFTSDIDRDSATANVMGLLRGRDPALRDELVVFTAHHDHLGEGKPDASGDTIYNGARDNAAGVAVVLAVARAFRALPEPPRRSVLFLLVGAEEQGLLGSRFYVEQPTVHPGRIAADLNFDSPNVFGRTRDVAVVGRGKSSLEDLLEAAAALQGRVVVNEPFPDRGYYYRSDQYNFARVGVPALYFTPGTDFVGRPAGWGREIEDAWRNTRYHQPSDEIYEDWSYEGMVEDARLAFWVGLAAAEADEPPVWRPGDEFAPVRARMLAEAEGR
jgi:Zn-dependent M28 family amino/carboxypeptidase